MKAEPVGSDKPALPLRLVLLPCAGVLALVVILHEVGGIGIPELTRDPAAEIGYPFYVGFLSHLGILLWMGAAVISGFTARLIWQADDGSRDTARFLAAAAALTLVLTLDDLFLVHELVIPAHLGIPEVVVIAAYGASALALLSRFPGVVRDSDHRVLVLSLTFFAVALATDLATDLLVAHEARLSELPAFVPHYYLLLENGSKFIGIGFWFAYLALLSFTALRRSIPKSLR